MKNKIIIPTIMIIVVILTGFFAYQRLNKKTLIEEVYALDPPNYQEMVKNEMPIQNMINAHHKFMNDFFNSKMKLIKKKDLQEELSKKEANPSTKDECPEDSVSTWCIAKIGSAEITTYLLALQQASKAQGIVVNEKTEKELAEDKESNNSLQNYVYVSLSDKENVINHEFDTAVDAFELALDLYNQYQQNYQLHKEYKKVIEDLEKYRDKLIKIREPSDILPDKFINVTTDKCT